MHGTSEQLRDKLRAKDIAEKKAEEIMKEMDICDVEHNNYPKYLKNLRFQLYAVMVKNLKL